MINQYPYTVGTSETGGFILCATWEEAVTEAKSWAKDEPGADVNIYSRNEHDEVIDTEATFRYQTSNRELEFAEAE